MNSAPDRPISADDSYNVPVPQQDRFARTDRRPQRNQPLMRQIEVAYLRPDLSTSYQTVQVPRTPVFEQTAAAFAHGTILPGVTGPVAVEDLVPGDYLTTSRGPQPVLWIGSTRILPGAEGAQSSLTHLTRITADAFGPARPERDVLLGPAARIERPDPANPTNGVLCPIADVVDGHQAFEVTPPSPVQVFHFRLLRHATFSIGGLDVESYHPGEDIADRLTAQSLDDFLDLFPGVTTPNQFGRLCAKRRSRDLTG